MTFWLVAACIFVPIFAVSTWYNHLIDPRWQSWIVSLLATLAWFAVLISEIVRN